MSEKKIIKRTMKNLDREAREMSLARALEIIEDNALFEVLTGLPGVDSLEIAALMKVTKYSELVWKQSQEAS